MKGYRQTYHSPYHRTDQIRCVICKGLLYRSGRHVNLSECEYFSDFYTLRPPLRGTVGWQNRSTGGEKNE